MHARFWPWPQSLARMCCLQLQRAVCTPETLRARSLEPPSPPNPNPSSLTNTLSVEALGTLSGGAVLAVDVAGATTGGVASTTAALGGSAGDGLGGSSSSGGGSGGNGLGGGRRGALAVVCESVSFEFLFGIPAGAPGYAKSRSARSSQVAQHASLTLCRKKKVSDEIAQRGSRSTHYRGARRGSWRPRTLWSTPESGARGREGGCKEV